MKKTYIKPTLETAYMGTQQILSASTGIIFDDTIDSGNGFLGDESADEGVEALSRFLDM